MEPTLPEVLTHYYRPFSRPFLSLSPLPDAEVSGVLAALARFEPLPDRLTHPAYLSERRRIEERMRQRFLEKGGRWRRFDVYVEAQLWSDAIGRAFLPAAGLHVVWVEAAWFAPLLVYALAPRRLAARDRPVPSSRRGVRIGGKRR
jgi:hypothetical protein